MVKLSTRGRRSILDFTGREGGREVGRKGTSIEGARERGREGGRGIRDAGMEARREGSREGE